MRKSKFEKYQKLQQQLRDFFGAENDEEQSSLLMAALGEQQDNETISFRISDFEKNIRPQLNNPLLNEAKEKFPVLFNLIQKAFDSINSQKNSYFKSHDTIEKSNHSFLLYILIVILKVHSEKENCREDELISDFVDKVRLLGVEKTLCVYKEFKVQFEKESNVAENWLVNFFKNFQTRLPDSQEEHQEDEEALQM